MTGTVVPFTPRPKVPEHRRFTGSPLERARCDVVNRVAGAIHMSGAENMPGYPTWEEFVDAAYENAETNPKMLEDVSNTIRAARAAIGAMTTAAPATAECLILRDIGLDHEGRANALAVIDDYVVGVLR